MDSISQLLAHLGLDLVAVLTLTFAVYYPRHRRRDLVPAYLALNVSLFAVVAALARVGGDGGLALGFGLFGVLSMIRLRSESIQNEEVAYYFTTLVLGLIAGLPHLPFALAATLCALPLAVVWAADHPRLFARTHRAVVTFDAALTEPEAVEAYVRERLGEPQSWKVQEIDYVRDLAVVDVRYRLSAAPAHRADGTGHAARAERTDRADRTAPAPAPAPYAASTTGSAIADHSQEAAV
ncbi:DUF4956 domain-containing protein [Streptomyces sp. NPDC054796]